MASDRSRSLWQKGISLSEAWRAFADPMELTRLDMPIHPIPSISAGSAKSEIIFGIVESLSAFGTAHMQKRELRDALKEDLLERLFNGDLIAAAYREQPTTSPSPIQLAGEDFDFADADWDNARLFTNGKTYGRVRVLDEREIAEAELPRPRRGRPGSTAAIDTTIDELLARNIDLQAMYRADACQLIRTELGVSEKRGNGLSDINLSKRIVAKCGIKSVRK